MFTVVVTNSAGSVTSSGAALTVNAAAVAPTITTQPTAALDVAPGNTATFTVTATGTTLIYQWKKGGTDIPGATSSSYAISNTTSANDGVYSVVVSNSAGTVTSSNATLTVSEYSLVANASGGFYDRTECVKDNSTGLIWEGKTASPATSRLGTSTYTNYDSTSSAQKWVSGTTYVNPTLTEIDATTNSIGYRNSVNTSVLCGYTDWRMPTKEELQGILASSGSPRIDTAWFPNTQESFYWASSPYVGYTDYAWFVDFSNADFTYSNRNGGYAVRLVRASQ